MKKIKYIMIGILIVITGCASSSDLDKKANNHVKAGDYYKSIGQPGAAKELYNEAKKDRDNANDFFPLLIELFNLFNEK